MGCDTQRPSPSSALVRRTSTREIYIYIYIHIYIYIYIILYPLRDRITLEQVYESSGIGSPLVPVYLFNIPRDSIGKSY